MLAGATPLLSEEPNHSLSPENGKTHQSLKNERDAFATMLSSLTIPE